MSSKPSSTSMLDPWNTREKLVLASTVRRCGDHWYKSWGSLLFHFNMFSVRPLDISSLLHVFRFAVSRQIKQHVSEPINAILMNNFDPESDPQAQADSSDTKSPGAARTSDRYSHRVCFLPNKTIM